jgi:hypothetical protein
LLTRILGFKAFVVEIESNFRFLIVSFFDRRDRFNTCRDECARFVDGIDDREILLGRRLIALNEIGLTAHWMFRLDVERLAFKKLALDDIVVRVDNEFGSFDEAHV